MIKSHRVYLDLFKALSDNTRMEIVKKLLSQKLCACELQRALNLGITQSSLSYHMKILTDTGLIATTREGKWLRYSVDINKFKELQEFLETLILQNKSEESEAFSKCKYYNQCGTSFKDKSLE